MSHGCKADGEELATNDLEEEARLVSGEGCWRMNALVGSYVVYSQAAWATAGRGRK